MDWLEALVAGAHQRLLAAGADGARAYLLSRGVTADEMIEHRLGFSADDLPIPACTPTFLDWYPKYWYNRLVFPLTDVRGQVIGLQTRALDQKFYQQFYAYSPVLPYFFGLSRAAEPLWRSGQLVIVEGVFDYFAVRKVTPAVVAVLTAGCSQPQRRFFQRYIGRSLTALLDMDEAGRQGVDKLLKDPARTYAIHAPVYPAHDPADLVAAGRLDCLQNLLKYILPAGE